METRTEWIYKCSIILLVVGILFLGSLYADSYKLNIQYEKTTNSCEKAYCGLLDNIVMIEKGEMDINQQLISFEEQREIMLICNKYGEE